MPSSQNKDSLPRDVIYFKYFKDFSIKALPQNINERTHVKIKIGDSHSTIAERGAMPALLGLRGLAAVSVVIFHINRQINVETPEWLWFIGTHFGHGVFLFFILSAFSLTYTNINRVKQSTWLPEYVIKRFFRIAPLFYAILLFEVLRQINAAGSIISSNAQLLSNITFTFGLVPHGSMVWAGWTVGVEMLFYAAFPALLVMTTNRKRVLLLLAAALLISVASRIIISEIDVTTDRSPPWAYFSFQSNLWFFALGMVTFFLIVQYERNQTLSRRRLAILSWLVIFFLLWASEELRFVDSIRMVRPDLLVFGILFSVLIAWQYLYPSRVLSNGFMRYLGERSFSIYLCHPVLLFYLRDKIHILNDTYNEWMGQVAFLVTSLSVLIVLLVIVEFTYRAIELNGLTLSVRACKAVRKRFSAGRDVTRPAPPPTSPAG